ncbi:molybdopterin synthase, catalytic subunit [Campylobacter blaseri]|uniref:Molybdopterin synthase catalytic subunit n=1 Tax=Campylobacter blaseri TaxID=2042961 RepID=A0A2P8R494_9BACT|nr:molybdenum cofactor biosynthesis protein MoaE [Campylobacter blaseri]PSM53295.1 molybdenum cofactor biosynthesis protein MoaE [Campylobacter blaseri]PSM54761.1 molybdenum cofactor biosynthesis protein MoaE [Campylobacter blaseri]QKF86756.1 molybdopterin synthase, catalytic subunit [Campylobacter blaseri]
MEIEIYEGNLDVPAIYASWYNKYKLKNLGALIVFSGIVRSEGGIEALSFDIHKPILQSWFDEWSKKAEKEGAILLFAHSLGDVRIHESSYVSGIVSKQRKVALRLINEFVEDFKANAPIWKYDVINGERIYAKNRSHKLKNAGILKK